MRRRFMECFVERGSWKHTLSSKNYLKVLRENYFNLSKFISFKTNREKCHDKMYVYVW